MGNDFTLITDLLDHGGKPAALAAAIAEIVSQSLSRELYISEHGKSYILRETEYLLMKAAHSSHITENFVKNRVSALKLNLLRLGLACPRSEIPLSSLFPPGDDHDHLRLLEKMLHSRKIEPAPGSELRKNPPARRLKTLLRSLRLERIPFIKTGLFKSSAAGTHRRPHGLFYRTKKGKGEQP